MQNQFQSCQLNLRTGNYFTTWNKNIENCEGWDAAIVLLDDSSREHRQDSTDQLAADA